ncbi:cell differentiation protein rcd1-like isoform X2 [Typha angustifolia]|uniref:cell differentiation protein rcd1-like isoform X2 n=1 Tax=Typha angustifolia TaxID=59011 RepID=UPI003C2EEF4D
MANTTPLSAPPSAEANNPKNPSAEQLILDLRDPNLREDALISLSKKRERFEDLALLLWNSSCTITVLLQEIISIYRYLYPPILSASDSNRVCNALALFQCVASDPRTKTSFLNASILLYFYPFLLTTSKARPFEYLRLTTLGVIGALVKLDDSEVVRFLLQTQVVPLCLHSMEIGSELSKTVGRLHVQRLVYQKEKVYKFLYGLEKSRASIILNNYLPDMLKDGTIDERLRDDPGTRKCLHLLLHNVSAAVRANQQGRI